MISRNQNNAILPDRLQRPGQLRQAKGQTADAGGKRAVSLVEPGRLIGDLSVITGEPRHLDLVANTDCSFLRIGAEELRAVLESDASVAAQLLKTVAQNLTSLAGRINASQNPSALLQEIPKAAGGEDAGGHA